MVNTHIFEMGSSSLEKVGCLICLGIDGLRIGFGSIFSLAISLSLDSDEAAGESPLLRAA